MPKGIDQFVSENRRDLRRVDATQIEVAGQRPTRFNFGTNTVAIPTSIEVYTRPLNNSLISGHPDAKHGSGNGVAGDVRGGWTLVEDVEVSEEFVRDGRKAIRDALAGDPSGDVSKIAVGTGTADAQVTDTTLQTETARADAWGRQGATVEDTLAQAHFLFADYGDSVAEFGVISSGANLFNRITTSAVNPTNNEELRVDINFTVNGDGNGNSVVTNDGEEAIAASIRNTDTIGLNKFVFGSGSTEPSKSDTMLATREFAKVCERLKDPETVTAHSVVMESEPSTQPHTVSEIGLEDNTGRLLWRTLVDSFEKNANTQVEVFAGFRAK